MLWVVSWPVPKIVFLWHASASTPQVQNKAPQLQGPQLSHWLMSATSSPLYDGWLSNPEEKNTKSSFSFERWATGGVSPTDLGVNVVLLRNGDIAVYDWSNGERRIGCKNNSVELPKKNTGSYRVLSTTWGCVICEVKLLSLATDRVVGSRRCFLRCRCSSRSMYLLARSFTFTAFVCCPELWCTLCLKKTWSSGLRYWRLAIELAVFA